MKTSSLEKIVAILDKPLRAEAYSDSSHNGLQVANSGKVSRVACGVDASLEFFQAARRQGADLCIVHHGMSWGDSLARLTGAKYDLVKFLMQNDMALYASHIPLDAHPTLGNNALLAKALGLQKLVRFGRYHGAVISFQGSLAKAMGRDEFRERIGRVTGNAVTALPFGAARIRTVALISGGGAEWMEAAANAGMDAFVTGEIGLCAYNIAKQAKLNAFAAGHYATETLGVKALGALLQKRCGIPAEFIDLKIAF